MLEEIGHQYGLLTVSEILDPRDVWAGVEYLDIIQIVSRNMSNFALLKEVGKTQHPVLLKRGHMSTVWEFFMAAEYIVSEGNTNVILCENGIMLEVHPDPNNALSDQQQQLNLQELESLLLELGMD